MYFPTSSILIEFLILAIIDREDSYGYEISQTIKLVANIKESTLYPILKKLEKAGYMTTYSQAYQGVNVNITVLPKREKIIFNFLMKNG